MNFYKRHIGDYIKDAGHLTLLEHGVYTRLLDVYYTREAGIPEDKAARLVGARSKDEVQALTNVLDEFFDLVDGLWIQNRCEAEIEAANQQADANRNNGKKGGRPKRNATEQKPIQNPLGFISDNENNLSQTPDSRLQIKPEAGSSSTVPDRDEDRGVPPLPTRETLPLSDDPAIQLAVHLRRQGVNAQFTHPAVQDWVKAGIDFAILDAAVRTARERLGESAKIQPNYLVPIVNDIVNPPAATPGRPQAAQAGPPRKPQGMDPKGLDESYDDYQARIDAAEANRRKGPPP